LSGDIKNGGAGTEERTNLWRGHWSRKDRNQGADEQDGQLGSHEADLEGEHTGTRVSPAAREAAFQGVQTGARSFGNRPIFVDTRLQHKL